MLDVFTELKKLKLPKGEYVVVGGAMEAHKIRKAHDLDILATPNLYLKLQDEGFIQSRQERDLKTSRLLLDKGETQILPNFLYGNYTPDTKKLIRTADIIKGFPFIKLTELIKFKKELARPKDIEDIRLIKEYLKKGRNK